MQQISRGLRAYLNRTTTCTLISSWLSVGTSYMTLCSNANYDIHEAQIINPTYVITSILSKNYSYTQKTVAPINRLTIPYHYNVIISQQVVQIHAYMKLLINSSPLRETKIKLQTCYISDFKL